MMALLAVFIATTVTTLATLAAGLASNWWRVPRWGEVLIAPVAVLPRCETAPAPGSESAPDPGATS